MAFKKNNIPWNKGKTGYKTRGIGKVLSETHKKNMALARVGRKPNLGRKFSDEWRFNLSKSLKGKNSGSKNASWKGGRTPENIKLRTSSEYSNWRNKVFERDSYTCLLCGSKEHLEAHHFLSFADCEDLRFEIINGITVCSECHCKIDKYRKNWGSNGVCRNPR